MEETSVRGPPFCARPSRSPVAVPLRKAVQNWQGTGSNKVWGAVRRFYTIT